MTYCNNSHHICDILIKNSPRRGWYSYDGMNNTLLGRMIYHGDVKPDTRPGYMMVMTIYIQD